MKNYNGIVGSDSEDQGNEWENEYKTLAAQLANNKIITEEIWQETVNPLVPPDGVFDDDINILQHYGDQLSNEKGKTPDLNAEDKQSFRSAKTEAIYTADRLMTIRVKSHIRHKASFLQKFKRRLRVKKK